MLRQSHEAITLATKPLEASGSALGALTIAVEGSLADAQGDLMRGLLGLPPSSAHAAAWNTLDTLAALLAQCLAHAKCRADLEVRVAQQFFA